MSETKEKELVLPDEISEIEITAPRDLVIISQPKMGKGTILGDFTIKYNAVVLDLEKGGYEYIKARKMSTYPTQDTTIYESFKNYIKYRNLLLEKKGKYEYLIIDVLSDLDALSEIGGTKAYMMSTVGKKFNRVGGVDGAKQYEWGEPEYKSVLSLGDGAGYAWTRKWFLEQIEIFRQIAPYRLYAAHISDKLIKESGKDEVIGSEIALTGQLKRIFASKVTALAKLIADGEERYLNFDVQNDSIIAGSRSPLLKGKILISKKDPKTDEVTTFWETIYPLNK